MKNLFRTTLLLLAIAALAQACTGCGGIVNSPNMKKNDGGTKNVPREYADARLLSYTYSLQGSMRWPDKYEHVEICDGDSAHCVISLFHPYRLKEIEVDENDNFIPERRVVDAAVLDTIKQMIIDARAWKFKEDYSSSFNVSDGDSWGFTAQFEPTGPDSPRHGSTITSGGSNSSPDTELFNNVRDYLLQFFVNDTLPAPK